MKEPHFYFAYKIEYEDGETEWSNDIGFEQTLPALDDEIVEHAREMAEECVAHKMFFYGGKRRVIKNWKLTKVYRVEYLDID